MRSLHRDIGFFIIGLTILYAVSGIVLVYRDTGFLKRENVVEKQLSPNMETNAIAQALHLRDINVLKTENDIVYFQNGTYDNATGVVRYSEQQLPEWINKLTGLHKSSSKNNTHLFLVVYAALLLFLALSSFWMFNSRTKFFRRGLYIAGAGVVLAFVLLI